jgi:hypothetical protein
VDRLTGSTLQNPVGGRSVITKEQLAEREEAKLHYPGARLVAQEAHDEGDSWWRSKNAMLRRRWAFDANADSVVNWYKKRLLRLGWEYVGGRTFEGTPVAMHDFELDQDPLPPSGETLPQEFELLFLSAEEPDPPQNYWPDDGSTPDLHFQTTFVVPSTDRRRYPSLTAEIWKDGKYLGLGGQGISVTEFNGIQDQGEQSRIRELFRAAPRPEIDVTGAWDGEDEDCIRSRETFRWFIETYLPSVGYDTVLDEERRLSS